MRIIYLLLTALLFCTGSSYAQELPNKNRLEIDGQFVNTMTNIVRKGDNNTGTIFNANDYTGNNSAQARVSYFRTLNYFYKDDELRLVYAPYQQSGSSIPNSPISFNGTTFNSVSPLTILYKFNTYRATYDAPVYKTADPSDWIVRIGGTIAVRDAQIKLSQGNTSNSFSNVGPIPLFYFSANKSLSSSWHLLTEFDAFPAPGSGGLFDGSIKIAYDITKDLALTAGTRYLWGAAQDSSFGNTLSQIMGVVGLNIKF